MVAFALLVLPLAIAATPAQSHSSTDSETESALSDHGGWPDADAEDGDDDDCDCTGRRGRGHEHGRGHHSHGKGHGYGHGKGHGCGGDDDPAPAPVPAAAFGFNPASPVAGRDVSFDASASTGGVDGDVSGTIVSWSWNFGDGSTAEGATATHSFADAGDFSVTLTVVNDYGETNSSTQTVSVLAAPVPVASFISSPPAPVAGAAVQFDASASTGGVSGEYTGAIVSYGWDFGDGTTAEGATASRAFPAGDHSVTLTVTNDFGKSDSVTQVVHVVPPPPPYNPGGGTGGAPQTTALSVEPGALTVGTAKVSGGKLRVSSGIGFTLPEGTDPADACAGDVSVSGSARGVGKLRGRAALHARDGRCVAEFRHSLPASSKGKRIKLAYSFAGNDAVAAWQAKRTLKVKAAR